jgi:hypothetical protein
MTVRMPQGVDANDGTTVYLWAKHRAEAQQENDEPYKYADGCRSAEACELLLTLHTAIEIMSPGQRRDLILAAEGSAKFAEEAAS